MYDDDGNHIAETYINQDEEYSDRKIDDIWKNHKEHRKESYLNFRENEELRKISFSDACNMSLQEIKNKYLASILGKAKNIMRKGTLHPYDIPSPNIPDEYLEDLFALLWREDLKIWAIQWDKKCNNTR